jgi:phosphotransferase system  glucose/maltose/N-acetylglucosamine-specific IIC component
MKKYLKLYAYSYAIVSLIVFILALGINRYFEIALPLRALFIGGIIISLLIALSILIFKKTWGNGVLNVIVGYIIISPVPFVLRLMFGIYLFRTSVAIYILGFIYAVLYSLVILYGSIKNKKTEDKLNALLKDKQINKEE